MSISQFSSQLDRSSAAQIQSAPALNRFIHRLMRSDFPEDAKIARLARLGLQLAAISIAGAAQAGMVNINLEASGGNKILGGVLVVSNLSTFGSFYAYCSWIVLNEAFRSLSPEERALFKSDVSDFVRTLLKVSAAVVGAFSQVPMAYAAYASNNNSLFYGIARFLDAGLPIRSLYLGAAALFSDLNLNETEKQLEISRNNLCSLLKRKQSTLTSQTSEVRGLLNELPNIHQGTVEDYLRTIIHLPDAIVSDSKFLNISKKITWSLGHLSNLVVMALYGMITYDAMSLITDNEALKICAVFLVIASKFYLWKDSVSHAARQLPSDVNYLACQKTQKSISQVFAPKIDALATGSAYAIGAFSYGSMKYFCDLYNWGPAATVTSSYATALLAKNTFNIVKNGLLEEGLARWGSEDKEKLIKFSRELEKFITTLKYTYRVEFAKFLVHLPQDLKQVFYTDGLTDGSLELYINTKQTAVVEELESVVGDPIRRVDSDPFSYQSFGTQPTEE